LKIKFTAFDGGNISDLNKSYSKYKEQDFNVLLSNSNMYGCGMNLENTTDIILIHRINSKDKYKQVIGRAQRPGRTTCLNIYELLHDNELLNENNMDDTIINNISEENEDNEIVSDLIVSVNNNNNLDNAFHSENISMYISLNSNNTNNLDNISQSFSNNLVNINTNNIYLPESSSNNSIINNLRNKYNNLKNLIFKKKLD
jgi:hypothetical protein